jgi:hypothetical protein
VYALRASDEGRSFDGLARGMTSPIVWLLRSSLHSPESGLPVFAGFRMVRIIVVMFLSRTFPRAVEASLTL